ncbi:MAG: AMP-binding protein [Microbacteriaceae bacterium]|nr:AMP-binding protein [Microbacteriaceae bacterium]
MSAGADEEPPAWDVNWSQLWDRVANALPDAPAIETLGEVLSYAELEDRAARLARTFAELGVGPGDAVGLFLYNRAEYLESIYAAFKLGAVPVNMNFRYRAKELAELIAIARVQVLVAPSSLRAEVLGALSMVEEAAGGGRLETTRPAHIEIDDTSPGSLSERSESTGSLKSTGSLSERSESKGAIPYESAIGDRHDGPDPRSGRDPIYLFTGGTTGTPKAVVWRHGDLLDAQLVSLYGTGPGAVLPASVEEMVAVATDPARPAPRMLPIAPLMHSSAMFNSMNTLTLGGTVVFLNNPRFDPAQVLRTVQDRGVTRTVIAGNAVAAPLVDELQRAAAAGEPYDVSSLDLVTSSGMAWTDDSKAELLAHLRDALLFDIFGATEGGPFAYAFVRSADDLPSRIVLAQGAAVLDEDGNELDRESGETGVLAYAGPKPLGYLDAPEKTLETYRRVGERTYVVPGDFVRLVGGGRIEFLGRGSATVNTGGEKVYPAEVEDALRLHPDVTDAVVFGVADRRWGQAVAAVVAVREGSSVTPETLRDHVGEHLAGYKKPRRLVVVDSLERTPSGKADMRRLKALVESQVE